MGTLPNSTNQSPLSTANTIQNNPKYFDCFTRGAECEHFCASVQAKRFNGGNDRCRLRDASFNLNFARQN